MDKTLDRKLTSNSQLLEISLVFFPKSLGMYDTNKYFEYSLMFYKKLTV